MNYKMIYNVLFPKLGIKLKISPILVAIGDLSIRWYGVLIAVGFLLAFLYIIKRSAKFNLSKDEVESLTFTTSISAIICARIYYVVFYPGDFYINNPHKIFFINEGGIAIYGALIGGFIALWVISKKWHKNFFSLLDLISLGVPIGQAVGRWGNFFNQEAFGTATSLPWGMISENTLGQTVHPCFLYESIGCLLCFIFLHVQSYKAKNSYPGKIFLTYIAIYSMLRAFIESLRTDSLIIPSTNLRVSQVFSIVLCVSSVLILVAKKLKIISRNRTV